MRHNLTQTEAKHRFGPLLSFWVNPSHINFGIRKKFTVGNDPMPHLDFFKYFIIGGDWDEDSAPVSEDRNFLDIEDLIKFGKEYSKSMSFSRYVDEIIQKIPQKDHLGNRFESRDNVKESFEFYLNLIEKMRREGYIKKNHLNDGKDDSDIGVAIGRLGELVHFRKGHHRLAIAKQIGLDRVAVVVQLVHSEWIKNQMRVNKCEESLAIEIGLRSLATRYEI